MIVITERDGLIRVWTTDERGRTRSRMTIDAGGVELEHEELMGLALDLSKRFAWNGTAPEPATPKAPTADASLERKRAYNRDYYQRTRSASAKAAPAGKGVVPEGLRQRAYSPRANPAMTRARRDALVELLTQMPDSTVAELTAKVDPALYPGLADEALVSAVRSDLTLLGASDRVARHEVAEGPAGRTIRYRVTPSAPPPPEETVET